VRRYDAHVVVRRGRARHGPPDSAGRPDRLRHQRVGGHPTSPCAGRRSGPASGPSSSLVGLLGCRNGSARDVGRAAAQGPCDRRVLGAINSRPTPVPHPALNASKNACTADRGSPSGKSSAAHGRRRALPALAGSRPTAAAPRTRSRRGCRCIWTSHVRHVLAHIQVPTLILHHANDLLVPVACAQYMPSGSREPVIGTSRAGSPVLARRPGPHPGWPRILAVTPGAK